MFPGYWLLKFIYWAELRSWKTSSAQMNSTPREMSHTRMTKIHLVNLKSSTQFNHFRKSHFGILWVFFQIESNFFSREELDFLVGFGLYYFIFVKNPTLVLIPLTPLPCWESKNWAKTKDVFSWDPHENLKKIIKHKCKKKTERKFVEDKWRKNWLRQVIVKKYMAKTINWFSVFKNSKDVLASINLHNFQDHVDLLNT